MNNTGKKFGGRKKGTPNKKTAVTAEWVQTFLDANGDAVKAAFQEIADPVQKVQTFIKLLEYAIPKQRAMESTINIESIPADQIGELAKKILESE